MNEDNSIYDYANSEFFGKESGQPQSRFYFEIEAPKIASAPTEEHLTNENQVSQNVYESLNDYLTKTKENGKGVLLDNSRKEPTENKIETESATRSESIDKTDIYDVLVQNKDEYDEENEYMNYNQMATLKIRRHSPLEKESNPSVLEGILTHQQTVDEKSDFSTEEERSCTESGSSVYTDVDDYDYEVRNEIPKKATPVDSKRNSAASLEVSAVDSCSENSSDTGSDIHTTSNSNGNREQTSPLEDMSVTELCEILHECGLSRISKLCNEHSLDGAFLCALPTDSLQEQPFSLSQLEVMKISMMKKGWKPKIK